MGGAGALDPSLGSGFKANRKVPPQFCCPLRVHRAFPACSVLRGRAALPGQGGPGPSTQAAWPGTLRPDVLGPLRPNRGPPPRNVLSSSRPSLSRRAGHVVVSFHCMPVGLPLWTASPSRAPVCAQGLEQHPAHSRCLVSARKGRESGREKRLRTKTQEPTAPNTFQE